MMDTTFVNKILKSLMNHTAGIDNVEKVITESTQKISKIKLTEEEKQYVTKKYSDYVNIIKNTINENSDDNFQQKVSHKRNFKKNVVDSVVGESKLLWKPTQLTFHRDGGWENVRVAVPFNNHKTTPAPYFKGEGSHQDLFKVGFADFVQDIYALSEGETYYVYKLYLKEMYTRISYFIRENMETSEELNEENILKKYARKGFNKLLGNPTVSEKFVEKMAQFIERRWDEVVNVTWTYDVWGEMIFTVYIDEDDGQPTHIAQHPLEVEIRRTLEIDWRLHSEEFYLPYKIKVINLNKDTKLRGYKGEGINEVFSPLDDRIPNEDIKKFIDRVVKRMVDRTEINLYMEDYDPWKTGSPWFGDFITPQFPNDKKYKFNISWLLKEHFEKNFTFVKYFASELIEAYGFSTRGELEYFDYEYLKKLKEKVKLLQIPFIKERQKQKEEYHKRYNLSESRKDIKKERDDIERAVQDLNRLHNFDVSYEEMTRGIANSSPQPLSSEIWDELENTESNEISVGDFDKVFDISNKYNKSNPLKLKKKLSDGTYNYPIIVRFDDRYWLVAGNTRLCTAAAMGITPEVIIADINKPYPVDESLKHKNKRL